MLKHTISISCCLKVAVVALFCITKPRKKARSRLNLRIKKSGKAFTELFLSDLWLIFLNFKTIKRC